MNRLLKIEFFFLFLFLDTFTGMFYDVVPALKNFDVYKRIFCEFGLVFLALISFRKKSGVYLHLFLTAILVAVISTLSNEGINFFNFVNGTRDFIPIFFSIIFITNVLYSSKRDFFIRKMNLFIALFLLLNVPVCILQFLAFASSDWDAIGGTTGWGGSGNLIILIYLCTFRILIQNFNENKILQSLWKNKWLFLLWIPSFVCESKIVLFLIPLFIALLLKINLKNVLAGTLAVLLLFVGYKNFYTYFYGDLPEYIFIYSNEIDLEDSGNRLKNSKVMDMESLGDSRTLRLLIGYTLLENKIDWLIGKGLGHFKGSSTSQTKLAKENEYLVTGSRSFILLPMLQIGIIGSLLIYWAIFKSCFYLQNSRIKLFLIAVVLGITYYTVCFVSFYFCAIFFYAALSCEFTQRKDFARLFNFLNEFSAYKKSGVLV